VPHSNRSAAYIAPMTMLLAMIQPKAFKD